MLCIWLKWASGLGVGRIIEFLFWLLLLIQMFFTGNFVIVTLIAGIFGLVKKIFIFFLARGMILLFMWWIFIGGFFVKRALGNNFRKGLSLDRVKLRQSFRWRDTLWITSGAFVEFGGDFWVEDFSSLPLIKHIWEY